MRILSFLLVILTSYSVSAQRITGIVKDDQGKALSGANVTLQRAKDSSIGKIAATSASGRYDFISVQPGKYFVGTTFVSYKKKTSELFEVNGSGEIQVPDFILEKASTDLQDVTVTSKKPMVEVRADKTILNIEGTINATGNDALELLRKAPGVLLDKDDNISLAGKNGVKIYVDGKPTPLSGVDLAAYLKNIQSSEVESIEIITNPSAKYDAAGNAGIINIRLKKNKSLGTNGSVNAGWNIGTYAKYNAGASLNYRNKKINIFSNYSFNYGPSQQKLNINRTVLDSLFDQHGTIRMVGNAHNFKAGVDYFLNKKNTLGVIVNGTLADPTMTNYSHTAISNTT